MRQLYAISIKSRMWHGISKLTSHRFCIKMIIVVVRNKKVDGMIY